MSYIVVDKQTRKAVCELYSKKNAQMVNTKKYDVLSPLDYLTSLNETTYPPLTDFNDQAYEEYKNG